MNASLVALVAVVVPLAAEDQPGERPYEMVWAGRAEDTRPPTVDFESLDGEPVHLIFLLVSPPNGPTDHLRALEAISRHVAGQEYQTWRADRRHEED